MKILVHSIHWARPVDLSEVHEVLLSATDSDFAITLCESRGPSIAHGVHHGFHTTAEASEILEILRALTALSSRDSRLHSDLTAEEAGVIFSMYGLRESAQEIAAELGCSEHHVAALETTGMVKVGQQSKQYRRERK